MAAPLRAPKGTKPAGLRLWRSIVDHLELREDEVVLLREAVRIVDLVDELHHIVDVEGVIIPSARTGDPVPHPALVEARQQRLVLARLLATLRIPDADGVQAQRRAGARGAYLRGVS